MAANLIGRREWMTGLIGAGVVARARASAAFDPIEVNHVALRVADLEASEEFYRHMFGAPGIIFERPGQRYMRMGQNFVALFERDEPAMDHFAISVEGYDADAVEQKTDEMGLNPRRSSTFVYVLDPDGIEVQIAHPEHEVHSPVVREAPDSSVFQGNGVNHLAIRVSDIERSKAFYQRLFGLPVVSESSSSCFLGIRDNFLALFRRSDAGMDHFCISVDDYSPDESVRLARGEGLTPRRSGRRVYFDDPSGHEVQVSAGSHQP